MVILQCFILCIALALSSSHALEKIVAVHAGGRLEAQSGEYFSFFGIAIPDSPAAGATARGFLARLLQGHTVQVSYERPGATCDRSGAMPAYLDFVCDTCAESKLTTSGNTLEYTTPLVPLQPLLLEKGYARVDTAMAFSKRNYFLYLQRKAQKEGAGIWGPAAQKP